MKQKGSSCAKHRTIHKSILRPHFSRFVTVLLRFGATSHRIRTSLWASQVASMVVWPLALSSPRLPQKMR